MRFNIFYKIISLAFLLFAFTSCLKTRGDVSESEQSQVYSKKNAANQQAESQLNQRVSAPAPVDERDDMIRALNGRVESLENQINSANKEKSSSNAQEAQKIQLLQEALTKMEAQLQKLEAEQIQKKAAAEAVVKVEEPPTRTTTTKTTTKKNVKEVKEHVSEKNSNIYELAQGHFANKEWKKAILNYQKYVEDFPKGKEVADAKYKIGVCFQELGMKEEAMAFFEEVVANFSKSEAGKKAKMRLGKLKK